MIPEGLLDESATNNEVGELEDIDLGNLTITLDDVLRAKDIIAGKFVPIPLPVSQQIENFYERDFETWPEYPSDATIQETFDSASLSWLFPNKVVLTFKTKAGHVAVLAVGIDNIVALRNQLTSDENDKICTEVTASLDVGVRETCTADFVNEGLRTFVEIVDVEDAD